MLKFCVEQWDKNKEKLRKDIENNLKDYNSNSYDYMVKKVVELIFNDENSNYSETFDHENITEIDDGDYQGTLLYVIPKKTYQPSEHEYLMTYVGYGSCSGCDTLQAIQEWDSDNINKDQFIKDIMELCLDIVQNTIKPYNNGWRSEERFTEIENQ